MPKHRRITRLSANLRYLRLQYDYTQTFLGTMLDCTRSALCKYESGDRAPSTDQLRKLARVYHISIDDLLNADLSGVFTKTKEGHT